MRIIYAEGCKTCKAIAELCLSGTDPGNVSCRDHGRPVYIEGGEVATAVAKDCLVCSALAQAIRPDQFFSCAAHGFKILEEPMDGQPRMDGKKFDEGKPKLSFVARSLLVAIAYIMEPGAVKYGRDNWRGGMAWSRPYDALLRHLTAWWDGESTDEESGKSHLWHAACELMFLIEYEVKGIGEDDRSTKEAPHE